MALWYFSRFLSRDFLRLCLFFGVFLGFVLFMENWSFSRKQAALLGSAGQINPREENHPQRLCHGRSLVFEHAPGPF